MSLKRGPEANCTGALRARMSGPVVDVGALLPHAGVMVLLDRIVDWDGANIRCEASSHRDGRNPLRCDDRLPALSGVEYAAQAIAAHRVLAGGAGPVAPLQGRLAAIRDLRLFVDRLDDVPGDVTISAQTLLVDGGRAIYDFAIDAGYRRLLQGRATVVALAPEPDA